MLMETWQWEAPKASEQLDVRAIETREEAVAEKATDITHAVTGTLQIWMMPAAALEETSTEVVGVHVLDPGRLTVIGTTAQGAILDLTMKTELETEVHAVIGPMDEPATPAPSASRQHLSPQKTSVIEGPCLSSNSLHG